MQLHIPTIGNKLTLETPWTFTLIGESRNDNTWLAIHGETPTRNNLIYPPVYQTANTTLPKGTTLEVQRIYIRKGKEDFDSITFTIRSIPGKGPLLNKRFWIKLEDANTIHYT